MTSSKTSASAPDSILVFELGRQPHEIEPIASENIVGRAVLEAQGSVMTNKYAEGYTPYSPRCSRLLRAHRNRISWFGEEVLNARAEIGDDGAKIGQIEHKVCKDLRR
jgi:hypothetical protein